jgi:hypothetical protein
MTTPPPVPPPSPPAPPPHLPSPSPPPNPTVNLPPDLVNKLAHSVGNWLYISGATLLGAAVALLAAYLAWRAVLRQINANSGQLNKQIEANRLDVEAQIAAEDKRRKRRERLDVVTEAYVIVNEIFFWATTDQRRGTDEAKAVLQAFELKVLTITAKLDLVEMKDESSAVIAYWLEAKERANRKQGVNLPAKYGEILEALKHAVDS